jgi:restriction system protein
MPAGRQNMAIPDYQSLMLPILRIASDGQPHMTTDLVESLSSEFGLTPDDREQLLPSGQQRTIVNRTHWAVTYLAKTRLLERVGRGTIRITDRGREVLGRGLERIDIKLLAEFPELQAFRAGVAGAKATPAAVPVAEQTPEEILEHTFAELRRTVEVDLLDRVIAGTPLFFEQLVVDLLQKMGYGGSHADAARRVGRTGDDGIDGVIDEDKLGLDAVYVQAKRWDPSHPVRRPDLQAFAGSLEGQRASKGVFITTSRFTEDAAEYVTRIGRRIVLIDGQMLSRLMYDYGIGARAHRAYELRRVDGAYFEGDV